MNIALHGHGLMGQAVERVAEGAGHRIVAICGSGTTPALNEAHVLIDFSHASVLDRALQLACDARIPLVIGTTGWTARLEEVRGRVAAAGIGCVWASNFSPGANVTFALARRAGELFARFPQYATGLEERHHERKKDVPSGTAISIATQVREGSEGRLDPPIASSRVGSEFGLHTLFFDSPDDVVEISHRARGRDGFARGAILAAEAIQGKHGLFRFDELVM